MDYHGLKLLWTWMYDVDGLDLNLSNIQIECKIKMIQVLSTMSIKNRTVLEEYKLLDMVKRWADQVDDNTSDNIKDNIKDRTETKTGATGAESDEREGLVKELMDEILDKLVDESNEANTELLRALRQQSSELYEAWSNLKVNFKIPKKQRIEERKEHERKLNSTTANTPTSASEPATGTFKIAVIGSGATGTGTGTSAYDRSVYAQDRFSRENPPKGK